MDTVRHPRKKVWRTRVHVSHKLCDKGTQAHPHTRAGSHVGGIRVGHRSIICRFCFFSSSCVLHVEVGRSWSHSVALALTYVVRDPRCFWVQLVSCRSSHLVLTYADVTSMYRYKRPVPFVYHIGPEVRRSICKIKKKQHQRYPVFRRNSSLQTVCDISIARTTGLSGLAPGIQVRGRQNLELQNSRSASHRRVHGLFHVWSLD